MIISLLLLFKYSKNSNQTIIYSQPISNSNFGAILVDPVTIDFEKTNYDIMPDYVCIKFGTYQRNNNANYKYSLYKTVDNKKEIINETIFNSSNLKDGENYCFGMNINADDKLSDYILKSEKPCLQHPSDSNEIGELYKNFYSRFID